MNELTFNQKKPEDIRLPLSLSVAPQSGSANIRVDIPVTPGRSGLQPRFSLVYNSAGGNSLFGMGWNLQGTTAIGLSLKKGLPRYDGSEKYSFGGQELIPWLNRIDGEWRQRKDENEEYFIDYYRATVDQTFARFEKWVHKGHGQSHWRIHSRDNQVMVFGKSADHSSRIHDPIDPKNIFQWLLESQFDNNGNGIHYEYTPEDLANVNGSLSYEWNRVYKREGNAQKYIKRVRYGNTSPVYPDDTHPETLQWLFEAVFDYGEHESVELPYHSTRIERWPVRDDPFSVYIGAFEQRTYRLCHRIMMFHHIAELGVGPTLIASTQFEYESNPSGTTLSRIHYNGYKRLDTRRYETKALPPLVFTYTSPDVEVSFRPAPEQSKANMPYGLGSMNYKWIDLYGEGLPGVLYESNECWYYKPNLGDGHFGKQQVVAVKPSISPGSYTLSDFDGDGNLNLVILQGKESGYYEYNRDKEVWDSFKPFIASPHIRQADVNTQFIDLTGDGRSDIVTIEQDRIVWFPSKGKEGFEAPKQIAKPISNGVSRAPSIGANPMLDYFFANMSGSGLPDQVRVLNGRVEYWPNLGNGKFATGVVMEDSPQLDFEFEFDASRVRLVDLDGSGTADLLYIGRGEIRYWINACGNRFVDGGVLRGLPFIDNISSAQVLDFLGDGTPCLVWSTALSSHIDTPIYYLRLTNGVRPRLLTRVQNSMGLETVYHYGYSGKHYLRDKQNEQPWITKLPTHRIVVDKAETIDHVANTRFTQWYEYHDGFFDGEERTFKGFCTVDQYDSEIYQGTVSVPEIEFSDPVCIRSWFHNGAPGWRNERTKSFYGDPFSIQLKDFEFEDVGDLGPEEFFHAVRSLSGQVIRTEVYGLDREGGRKPNPFKINHSSFLVRRTQAGTREHDPGFAVFQHTNLEMVYEEVAEDPKVTQIFNVLINDFGIPVLQASVAYPRISTDALPEQQQYHINAIQVAVDDIDILSRYEMIEWEKKTFEIKDDAYPASFILCPVNDIFELLQRTISTPLFHNEDFTGGEQSRLVQWTKTYYWNDAQTGVLPWRSAGTKTLIHHKEAACFPLSFLESILGERYHPSYAMDGLYVSHDEHEWKPGHVIEYKSRDEFYFPKAEIQPDGGKVTYQPDPYFLTIREITAVLIDASGGIIATQTTTSELDYHILAPYIIVDANNNSSEVKYDALGVVTRATFYGEILSTADRLERCGHGRMEEYVENEEINFDIIINNPPDYIKQCASFFYYELDNWQRFGLPLRSISLAREEWVHDGEGGFEPECNIQVNINYTDGLGRLIQSKQLVEPGPDVIQYSAGNILVDDLGEPILANSSEPRWRVSGHVVYNNKQLPVRQFEPYFSPLPDFESAEVLETFGQSGLIEYDVVGREKKMVNADGTVSRVIFTPWQTRRYDANDAVAGSAYELRVQASYEDGTPEKIALIKSLAHNDTPLISHMDSLGRVFLTEERNNDGSTRRNKVVLDSLGNPLRLIDPRNISIVTYQRDMLGRIFHETSNDSGPKWQFINVLDQSIHLWDARSVHQQLTYDTWGRIKQKRVEGALGMNHVTERLVYGEDVTVTNASDRNLLGQLVEHYDQAGVVKIHRYDLLDNVLEKERKLLEDYRSIPDWSVPDTLAWMADPPFISTSSFDALGRPKKVSLPDNTTRKYDYSLSGAIKQLLITTSDGALTDHSIISDVTDNARGQRMQIKLGNNIIQQYEYDPYSFRLKRKSSYRRATETIAARHYQNIRYTYDAVGNITHCIDNAQTGGGNVFLDPRIGQFTYDSFYQLIEAQGRTHQSLEKNDFAHGPGITGFTKGIRHISLNNNDLIQHYNRRYSYDLAGNMLSMTHDAFTDGGTSHRWRNDFWVSSTSNRSLPAEDESDHPLINPESFFDANGNTLYLPHLRGFTWNYLNQLASAVTIRREDGTDDVEYYVYGGDGQRLRKVWEHLNHGVIEINEKIYLDGCEIKRMRRGAEVYLERYTSHLSDGSERIALLHQWTIDSRGMETDNIEEKKIHYQLNDHLGSSSFELDEEGEIINYEEYFPFGGSAFIAGDNLRGVQMKDYRYTGKECDEATRLYFFGFRYYAPWLCRWLNPDPIGIEDGLNVYQFVHNNPVNEVDADGLDSGHIVLPDPEVEIEYAERSLTLTSEGPVTTGLRLNPTDAQRVRTPGTYLFDHPSEEVYFEVRSSIVDSGIHFEITEYPLLQFEATAVVEAPTRRRERTSELDISEYVSPMSDEEFNNMISELANSPSSSADLANYSEPQPEEEGVSLDPSDRMSIDPFDSTRPQFTEDNSPISTPNEGNPNPPASIVSELRESIIGLGGDSAVGQFGMGIVAGAVTIIAEPTYMVIDMGTLMYHAIADPTDFQPNREQWASDMATYIVHEMQDGREAEDMSAELLGNMAIDIPTLGVRHIPTMVETIVSEDSTAGERGVATFNLGLLLYGARQGVRGYGNLARRAGLTTGTERLMVGIEETGLSSTDLRLRSLQIEADLLNYEGPGRISDRGAQSLTVAVAEGIDPNTLETTTTVGTNSHQANSLINRLGLLRPGEVSAPAVRVGGTRVTLPANLHHAELSAIRALLDRGIEIGRVGTSRPGCSSCQIHIATDTPGFSHVNPGEFEIFTGTGSFRLHVRWVQGVDRAWFEGAFGIQFD